MSNDHVIITDRPAPRRTGAAWAVVILLIVLAAGGWYWYASRPQPAKVTRRDIQGEIPVNGEIAVPPSARADVSAPFRAVVDKVEVSMGKSVNRGDVLVQLSLPTAEAYHAQTKAALRAAETAYANAKKQLDGPVDAATQQVSAARAALGAATQPGQRTNPDGSVAVTPPPSGDYAQAKANLDSAQQALQQATADRDSQLIAYKQQLDAAREANSAARAGEKQGYVRAPITGTVLALNAQPGKEVGVDAKVPIATIVDLSAIQVQAPLDNNQAGYVKQDMPVRVSVAEIPNKQFAGRVTSITSRQITKAAGLIKELQYVALIDFKNTDAMVKPGMKPVVALETGKAQNALVVPADAIQVDNSGRPTVRVLRNGQWEQVAVETGVSDGRYTQIKNGVRDGDTVQVVPNVLQAATLKK